MKCNNILDRLVVIQDRTENNSKMWAIADRLGCKLAVKEIRKYEEVYGLVGNTYAIKDTLKAAGFRFDGLKKAWFAPRATFETLEA